MFSLIAGEAGGQNVFNAIASSSAQRNFMIAGDILIRQSFSAISTTSPPMAKQGFPFCYGVVARSSMSFCAYINLIENSFRAISFIRFAQLIFIMFVVFPIMFATFRSVFFRVCLATFFAQDSFVCFICFLVSFSQTDGNILPWSIFLSPSLSFFAVIPALHLFFLFRDYMRTRFQFFLIGIELLAVTSYPSQCSSYEFFRVCLGVSTRYFTSTWTAIRICFREVTGRFCDLALRAGFHIARVYIKELSLSTC